MSDPRPVSPTPWWAPPNPQTQILIPADVRPPRLRRWIRAVASAAIFVAAAGWILQGAAAPPSRLNSLGGVEHRQTTEALLAGCGPTFDFTQSARDESFVVPRFQPDEKTLNHQTYPTIVPMYGPMWPQPPRAGQRVWGPDEVAVAPDREEWVRSMWNGDLVVYYTPSGWGPAEVDQILRIPEQFPVLNVIVTPWKEAWGALPAGRHLAVAAWGASQTCDRFDPVVLTQFRDHYPASSAPGAGGVPPHTLAQQDTTLTAMQ